MTEFPRWKYALVAIVVFFGLLYALPNVFPQQPAVQISANRGGTIDEALKGKVKDALDKEKIAFSSIDVDGDRLVTRFGDLNAQAKASDILRTDLGENYNVALNLASTVPPWLRSIGANSMPLGLDLQGGVHFLLQVDQSAVLDKQESRVVTDISNLLKDKKVPFQSANRGANGVVVTLRTADDRNKAAAEINRGLPEVAVKDGPSTDDSYSLVASFKPEKLKEISQNIIRQNTTTLRNRVSALGEPVIQQQGESRIVVELAGVQDTADAKRRLGATATLEYHPSDPNPTAAAEAERTGVTPPDSKLYHMRDGRPVLLKKKIIATGDELVDASAQPDQRSGTPSVSVKLNAAGGKKMLDFTMNSVGKPMGVVYIERIPQTKIVDGKEVPGLPKIKEEVINNATIQSPFSTQFQTTGLESMAEATNLAQFLRAGSLAAPVDIVEERVIGPSLGADNIAKGVRATILGLALVIILVGFYYKTFGLIADVALILNLILLVAILSIGGATLTLPGIAGIVLTLGMAIDANVLICERIREELRNGSTPMASIHSGYEKAWATILDANVTHLISSIGLMAFGSGPIRSFAITLAIGILTSMFTSVMVTHALAGLMFFGRKLKTLSV
jgi:preprotein translocase subunit SecD